MCVDFCFQSLSSFIYVSTNLSMSKEWAPPICPALANKCLASFWLCRSSMKISAPSRQESLWGMRSLVVVKPHPVAMIQTPRGIYKLYARILAWLAVIFIPVCNRYSMRPSVLWNIQARARGRSPEGELPCICIKHEDFSFYMCFISRRPRTYRVIIKI